MTPEWASKYFVEDIREGLNAIKHLTSDLWELTRKAKGCCSSCQCSIAPLPEGSESQAAKYLERQLNDMT